MGQAIQPYGGYVGGFAIEAPETERAAFIRKTYLHLVGAVLAFIGIEAALLSMPAARELAATMTQGYNWLIVLGLFLLVSWGAEHMAQSAMAPPVQYLGLGLFVLAEAVLFLPLMLIAEQVGGASVIPAAGLITVLLFTAMTIIVFMTGTDFSFLRSTLYLSGFVALGLIICSMVFGFSLGIIFSVVMIAFACGWILYDTSMVLHHYRVGQHVAASLALFASLALLLWYVLRVVIALQSRD